MSNKKKKAKNSDYRYLQRHYDEQREAREREERKKEQKKRRFILILAVVLILGALVLCAIGYAQNIDWMAPVYLSVSAVGMILIWYYYREDRPKYATTALVVGIVILVVAFLQARQFGWLENVPFFNMF